MIRASFLTKISILLGERPEVFNLIKKKVLLFGTLDTKGLEIEYIKNVIEREHLQTLVMDVSTSIQPPLTVPDIKKDEVCKIVNKDFNSLVNEKRLDVCMNVMGKGASILINQLFDQKIINGVLSIGGNQGSFIAGVVMKSLPIGVPKVLVSTIASGNTRPYIGCSDVAMIFSIADFVGGPNTITKTILANAAGAIIGMCKTAVPINVKNNDNIIAITSFGNLEPAIKSIKVCLNKLGYEVIVFHASGAGGSAMEKLIENYNIFSGIIELVPHEIIGEIFPEDFYSPVDRGRLIPMVEKGIPCVLVPGGLDYFVFGNFNTIPKKLRKRKIHYHNPDNTNVRLNETELTKVAKLIAKRLSKSKNNIRILIPKLGWTEFSKKGRPLYDPEADKAFVSTLRKHANPKLSIKEVPLHVNDPRFAKICVNNLLNMLK